MKYTRIYQVLDLFMHNHPKPKSRGVQPGVGFERQRGHILVLVWQLTFHFTFQPGVETHRDSNHSQLDPFFCPSLHYAIGSVYY